MSHRISISALTHVDSPVPCHDTSESSGLVDARRYLLSLLSALEKQGPIDVPTHVVGWLSDAAAYFQELDSPATLDHPLQTPLNPMHIPHARLLTSPPSRVISRSSSHQSSPLQWPLSMPQSRSASQMLSTPSPRRVITPSFQSPLFSSIENDVVLNRQTMLSTLYTYDDVCALVEYPQTSAEATSPIGHLFRRDPLDWQNPTHSFAYSLGSPSGQTRKGRHVYCKLLLGHNGNLVPCIESHYTSMCCLTAGFDGPCSVLKKNFRSRKQRQISKR
jgi:hypothetical protein